MEIDFKNINETWIEVIKEFDSDIELAEFDCKFGIWAEEKLKGDFYRKFDMKYVGELIFTKPASNLTIVSPNSTRRPIYICKFYFENTSDAVLFKLKS